MGTTELSSELKDAVIVFVHISGAIFLLINIFVCILIVSDRDERGKGYRKYLLSLQLFSMTVDVFGNCYIPILQVNCRLAYSDSWLANYLDIVTFVGIAGFLLGGVFNSYFCCVYYRRSVVLPAGRFWFVGWGRLALFLLLQTAILAIVIAVCVLANATRTAAKDIPPFVSWLTAKPSYLYLQETPLFNTVGTAAVIWGLVFFAVIGVMIGQVLRELKHGMHHASSATKKYQTRASVSLVFQDIVPTLLYAVPVIIEVILYLSTLKMGPERAARSQMISSISAVVFSVITTHTVAHSLTIIIFSPSSRKTVKDTAIALVKMLQRRISGTIEPVITRKSVLLTHLYSRRDTRIQELNAQKWPEFRAQI